MMNKTLLIKIQRKFVRGHRNCGNAHCESQPASVNHVELWIWNVDWSCPPTIELGTAQFWRMTSCNREIVSPHQFLKIYFFGQAYSNGLYDIKYRISLEVWKNPAKSRNVKSRVENRFPLSNSRCNRVHDSHNWNWNRAPFSRNYMLGSTDRLLMRSLYKSIKI
jgi:hypothetical protein